VQTVKLYEACMLWILYVCQRQSTQNRETDIQTVAELISSSLYTGTIR